MDLKELNNLSLLLPETTIDTEVAPGQFITQHPAGVRNFIRFVVRRYPSVRNSLTAPVRAATSGAKTDEEFAKALDIGGQVDQAIDDRDEADTTLIALTLCRPRSLKELEPYEAWVAKLPDEAWEKALAGAQEVTYAGDPASFFGEVQEKATGMNLMRLMAGQAEKADEEKPARKARR